MHRRGHRKSRNGCIECKRRHMKVCCACSHPDRDTAAARCDGNDGRPSLRRLPPAELRVAIRRAYPVMLHSATSPDPNAPTAQRSIDNANTWIPRSLPAYLIPHRPPLQKPRVPRPLTQQAHSPSHRQPREPRRASHQGCRRRLPSLGHIQHHRAARLRPHI